MKLLRSVCCLAIIGSLLSVPILSAATKQDGLQISPLRSRPVQNPGDTSTGELAVTNHSGKELAVKLSVERFKVTDEAYHYDFAPGEYTDWVRLADTNVQLNNGDSKKIAYSLAVPANAPPGGYYFALFASSEQGNQGTSFTEVQRVASLIYLEVSGLIERKASLLGVDVAWLQFKQAIPVSTRVSNQGNSHFQARIKQTIMPMVGHVPESQQTEGLILPSTIRNLEKPVQMPRWPGIYRLITEFSPPQGNLQKSTQTIIYLPPFMTALFVAILGGVVTLGVKLVRKRRKHRT